MNLNKGLPRHQAGITPILTIFIIAALGIMSIPAVSIFNNNEASPSPTPVPTASPTSEPTDTPTPTLVPTASPSPAPTSNTSGSNSVTIHGTSSSHVRTETNGVVHDVTINGNGSYNLDEDGTSIHINNN